MEVRFLSQPFASSQSLDDFVDGIASPAIDRVTIVTAWAKGSGLSRIADRLDAFRSRGGRVEIIVGVSEGGATKEGLQLAMDLSDEAFVFHDPARTFHPKVYLATGAARREAIVGSSNLTAGGLGWNYEASLWISEDGDSPSSVFRDVTEWITNLRVQPMSCRRLDPALLASLLVSSDIAIASEGAARRSAGTRNVPEDSDSTTSGTVQGLFSAPAIQMRPLPPLPSAGRSTPRGTSTSSPSSAISTASPTASTPSVVAAVGGTATVLRRWFRELDRTQAQQVPRGTNPTGNLRLTQAGHAIRHETYFFRDFFGGLPWSPSTGNAAQQEVIVNFNCTVDGVSQGILPIRVSHYPARISGQANIPSVLHWGPTLGALLRNTSYVGQFVTLERLSGGTFTLTIDTAATGPFIA